MTAAGALLAGLMACTVPGGANSAQGSEVPIPAGQGLLVLKWKGEARNLLGSSWASSVADAYELILQAAAGTRAVVLDSGSGQAVSVDPGTYRATVLAGVKRSSGSSTAFLVGSATEEAVAVVLGQRTEVNFVMKSIDLGLSAGGPAYWKGSLTVNASGKTRNPRVGMQLAGASTTNRPRFKSVELWNGYHEAASVTGTPDDWTAQVTGTVPSSGTGLTVGLIGAALCVQDLDNQWIPTSGTTGFSWYWTNRADLADAHPLVPFSEVAVACGPPPTGLDVSLGWE
jgi:hypothetical protein